MNDTDQRRTLRELIQDALEVTRSAPAESNDPGGAAAYGRIRESLTAAMRELDDFASRDARGGA